MKFTNKDNEVWKKIVGFPGYLISNQGRVKSCLSSKEIILKPAICGGYPFVYLRKDGKSKKNYIHRLVAGAFIPNPTNKPKVDHINTRRCDNRVINLRWVTHSENNLNSISRKKMSNAKRGEKNPNFGRIGRKHPMYGRKFADNPRSIPIVCVELNRRFSNAVEAGIVLNIQKTGIRCVLRGKQKTAGGYHWIYANKGEANEPQ